MNWKYVAILIVVIILVLVGSIYMLNSSTPLATDSKQIYFDENISTSEVTRPLVGVYREIASSTSSGSIVEVSLNVTIGDSRFYAIEEIIPANWTVSDPGTGTLDSEGKLKWVILDAQNTVLKYRVVAPSSTGKYIFSGKYAIGTPDEYFIAGNTQITVR
jgi:hypothetical protein